MFYYIKYLLNIFEAGLIDEVCLTNCLAQYSLKDKDNMKYLVIILAVCTIMAFLCMIFPVLMTASLTIPWTWVISFVLIIAINKVID